MPYRRPYNAVVRYAITLNDHHYTSNSIASNLWGPDVRFTVRAGNTSPPFLKENEVYHLYNELGTGVPR